MKKEILIGAIIFFILSGFYIFSSNMTDSSAEPSSNRITNAKTYTVEINSNGYSPKELEINQGDRVTWINKNSVPHWPASAMHPTHTLYPGSGIDKCGTEKQKDIFDACRGLNLGENWSFVFDLEGSWAYHDHLNLANVGRIIVRKE